MRRMMMVILAFCVLAGNVYVLCGSAAQTSGAIPDASQLTVEEALACSSGLPVISITMDDEVLPGEEMLDGSMTVLTLENGVLSRQTERIGMRLRGNTSHRFPKQSYRVTIVDEEGQKKNLSIGGLRSDDDWILNPLYTDTSKIREALAYELWNAMNSSGVHAASSRLIHAEVFLNGEYWGLYGIQERIDRKQVNGDKRSGILYKVAQLDKPAVQELLNCESNTLCAGFELDFAGAGVQNPWEPAAAYMALMYGEEHSLPAVINAKNLVDYGLWAMLTQAHDCHFKNQFLNCVYNVDSYTMYKIPWDLNNTFGDIWRNDATETNNTRYNVGDLVFDSLFAELVNLCDPAVDKAVRDRWAQLRATVIREELLIERAHALYDPLFEALERDTQRWPECGMGNGNALNIRDIEDFIRMILPRMDRFVDQLRS